MRERPPDADTGGGSRLRHDARTRGAASSSAIVGGLCGLSVLLALVPLAFILFFVVTRASRPLNCDFFTQLPKPVGEAGGGMANAIVGTLMLIGTRRVLRGPDRRS